MARCEAAGHGSNEDADGYTLYQMSTKQVQLDSYRQDRYTGEDIKIKTPVRH